MRPGSKTTLRAANESGKTSVVAAAFVTWHLALFPGSQVVCTSGVWRQVVEQLWRHLRRYGHQFGWKVTQDTVETPQGSKAMGFSTTDGGKFEGFHADDHLRIPLAILVDEAKSVDEEIFQAIERCRPTRLLVQSSPGPPLGGFYEACQDSRFNHFKVTAFDCPHLGPEKAAEVAKAWGTDSMLYKSMIEGEWMVDPNQTFVCSRRAIERAISTKINRLHGRQIAAIDVAHAETGNENVLALRSGNLIELDSCFVGNGDANSIVDRLITRLNLRRLTPQDVWIDGDGMGAIYQNIFQMKGWPINIWKGSEKAFDKNTFYNRSAEAWMTLARGIEKCELIFPTDEKFFKQLTEREYFVNTKGQIQLKPKDDDSPDRADAISMVWSINTAGAIQVMNPMEPDEWRTANEPDLEWRVNSDPFRNSVHRNLPRGWNCGM
jgi:phage terminase large subunit